MQQGLYFDELSVGQRAEITRVVGAADIEAFADVSGDTNPVHLDEAYARTTTFGGRIAHGMLLLSYSVGLAPIDPDRVVALRGFDRVVFKRPVHIGDEISLRGKVEGLKPIDGDNGLALLLWRLTNQEDRLVLRADAEIVWRRTAPALRPVYL